MGEVYKNCILAIAAADAEDSWKGILRPRAPGLCPHVPLAWSTAEGLSGMIYLRPGAIPEYMEKESSIKKQNAKMLWYKIFLDRCIKDITLRNSLKRSNGTIHTVF